jgi:hypothetical protein
MFRADGHTDMTKLTVVFRPFANALNNVTAFCLEKCSLLQPGKCVCVCVCVCVFQTEILTRILDY